MRGWYFLKTTVACVFINGYYDLLSVYLLNRASPARARLGESPPPERAGGAFFRSRPLVVPSGVKLEDTVVYPHDDAVLHEAQAAAVRAATVGTPAQDVDRAARERLVDAGFGSYFIHRTGHGIGVEEHEDPYIVEGNATELVAGNAFSIEPGIYIPGKWGMRLEDIVVASEDGPDPLNNADHQLAVLG